MTPPRLDFLLAQLYGNFGIEGSGRYPLDGLKILDAGCGGGLVSEPLARLGANVTAIDPSEECIEVARHHAAASCLEIDYRVATVESLPHDEQPFDAAVCMDVIEHVPNPELMLQECAKRLTEDGLLVASTLNRTGRSFLLAIVGAERILRWVPRNTHSWDKFLRPDELRGTLRKAGLQPVDTAGIVYRPIHHDWRLSETDVSVNYAMSAVRKAETA